MIAMRNRNKMERLSGNSSSTTIAKLSIDVTTTILFFFKLVLIFFGASITIICKPGFQTKKWLYNFQ